MLFKLLYLFHGYLTIEINGYAKEKLINFLIRSELKVWDIINKEGQLEAKLSAKDFKEVRKYVRRAQCKVRIKSKHGLPFLINKSKSRKAFIVGVVVAILTIYILSSFIWFVEIKGVEETKEAEVFSLLKKAGFEYGMLKYKLDISEVEKRIRIQPEVAWANVELKGTKLLVDIVEKVIIDQQTNGEQAVDIVAKKSGLIEEVIVLQGQPVIKEGEVVQAGEKLVSGTIKYYSKPSDEETVIDAESKKEQEPVEIKKVVAKGIVKAKVWYESYGEVRLIDYHQQKTEDIIDSISIKYKDMEIKFYGPKKPPFTYFKVEKTTKSLPSWRNINLPIEIIRRRYIKVKEFQERRSLAEAKKLAKKRVLKKILSKLDENAVIIDKDLKVISMNQEVNNIVRVKALIITKEDIALQENIQ
ncbi:sporulation protein YqfD [Selenihalanaerobacter shriftii]|uniref:Similar to stage IV sporulation protein n=1 Tax=Selenihalanaerobacter shriftii TaxID=142842 RepID=A0A1T4PZE3_9FIRM|nr:sporulation protein YqfD [Selenihalanaerobacter shriftii]SJZ96328.1 similar to stage IV sporulation protein [Selenihalanaerobacter shriftii]